MAIKRGLIRLHLSLEKTAAAMRTRPADLLPIKEQRFPQETTRTPVPGGYVETPGYLEAVRHGACPLIVEDERPTLLMPAETDGRKVSVYRWHLANYLAGAPFAAAGPSNGWDSAVIEWPIDASDLARMEVPGPSSGPERLIFIYRLLCAEREAQEGLAALSRTLDAGRAAVELLIWALLDDGRHERGEPWPDLRSALTGEDPTLSEEYAGYCEGYGSVSALSTDGPVGLDVFWEWCCAGALTGRFWIGWSGSLLDEDGPLGRGPLAAPFVVVWTPGWCLRAADLASIAAASYMARPVKRMPLLAPDQVSLGNLLHQRRWLINAAAAAKAVSRSSAHLRPIPSPLGGPPIDQPTKWAVQEAHRLGMSPGVLAGLFYAARDVLPDWNLSRPTIKKRLQERWKRYVESAPIEPFPVADNPPSL